MENTNENESKMENIKKNQDMVIEKTVAALIKELKEKGIDVSQEKELITAAFKKCVMLSQLALMFSL